MNLFKMIKYDLEEKCRWYYDGQVTRGLLVRMLFSDGTLNMIIYRFQQFFTRLGLIPVAYLLYKLNSLLGNVIIGVGAEFDAGFVIIHSSSIVINGRVRGGKGIKIEHEVTIGAEKNRSPVLGDDIFIGAGAKIIGPVRIGNHVRIGANAVVLDDIPDGATAVGIPAKVVKVREL